MKRYFMPMDKTGDQEKRCSYPTKSPLKRRPSRKAKKDTSSRLRDPFQKRTPHTYIWNLIYGTNEPFHRKATHGLAE